MLRQFGLEPGRAVKLYRHSPHRHRAASDYPYRGDNTILDVERVYAEGRMVQFHGSQDRKKLGNDLVGTFIAENDGATRFVGMFKINATGGHTYESKMAREALQWRFMTTGDVWYELEHDPRFKLMEDRTIVTWPIGRNPGRWLVGNDGKVHDIAVQEIRSPGAFSSFPGFSYLILNYRELKRHHQHEATSPWVKVLRTTRGIYLITDLARGNLYVGSATGRDGLWGRWSQYAITDHGGNKYIRLGIGEGTLNPSDFQISVLETLSNLASKQDGIEAEVRWKKRLGNKALTLNGN